MGIYNAKKVCNRKPQNTTKVCISPNIWGKLINFNLQVIVQIPLEKFYNTTNQSLDTKTVYFGERNFKIGPKLANL